MIGGAQLATGALLSIQPVTTFTALIRASTCVESLLRSGNFPALSAFAKQATASSNSNNSSGNTSSNNSGTSS